jgi:AcrR family transcriptional regulator
MSLRGGSSKVREVREASVTTRERILAAARDLFAEHGYDATSVRMVARHCGLTNPAVHYHFRTKRDLYDALLAAPVALAGTQEPLSRLSLAAHMEQLFGWWAGNVPFGRLLLRQQIAGDEHSLEYLHAGEADYHRDLQPSMDGLFGPEVGRRVSEIAFAMLSGLFWDTVLTYGSEAGAVMEQDYFRQRVRSLIEAALDAGERACR